MTMMKSLAQSADLSRANGPRDSILPRELPQPNLAQRELVARIVVSPTFVRSERLSSLLTYVCDMTLNGREREINEQKIGQAVFGRSRDYDSTIDGIVRTQASRLRQRLDVYFQNEGAEEPIRIVIPRGGYVPFFEPHSTQASRPAFEPVPEIPAPLPTPAPANVQPGPAPSRLHILPWALSAFLAITLVVVVLVLRGVLSISPFGHPPVHPLWSRIFSSDHATLLVPGDSGLVIFQGLAGRRTTLDDYLQGDYRTVVPANPTPLQAVQTDLASRRYTSIVDLEIVQTLNQLAQAGRSKLQIRYARDLRPNDLKSGNVILVGAAEANPWVELYERNMNFVFHNNLETHIFSIINRSPQPNEPRQWDSDYYDPQHRVYGVVAFLPNLTGNGNTLILEGTSMSGTESAWDFVSNDSQLLAFLSRIRRSDGSLPHFELLLGTNNTGASAVRSTVLAWRIIA